MRFDIAIYRGIVSIGDTDDTTIYRDTKSHDTSIAEVTITFAILSLSLSAVTHAPFLASVLRPTSWPNARDRRDGEVN